MDQIHLIVAFPSSPCLPGRGIYMGDYFFRFFGTRSLYRHHCADGFHGNGTLGNPQWGGTGIFVVNIDGPLALWQSQGCRLCIGIENHNQLIVLPMGYVQIILHPGFDIKR